MWDFVCKYIFISLKIKYNRKFVKIRKKKIKNLWDDPFTNGQHIYILDS